ncbi:hypothetical protein [Caulobacter sp. NIBR2454]|uniref:hypothetical protein n=1 Tax=Caulobacter sp. NIBR2454 TaxID=3015996 RepID=UPI0022B6CB7B|nr:hypothetical protein [Caulobacter sp. NIBR2454]
MTDEPKIPSEPVKEGGVKTPDSTPSPSEENGMIGDAAPGGVQPDEPKDDEGGMVGEG